MARRRASMREGPLAELFRATEAAQKQAGKAEPEATPPPEAIEPQEETVEHVPEFAQAAEEPAVAAVPEPGTLALLGSALVAALAFGARRKAAGGQAV